LTKTRDWDDFTVAAAGKEGTPCGIESDSWKAKIGRFVPARLAVAGVR